MRKLLACLAAPGFLLLCACGDTEEPSTAGCEPSAATYEASDGGSYLTAVLPDDEEELASSVANTFCAPAWELTYPNSPAEALTSRVVLPKSDADCIADSLIESFGAPRVRDFGLGAGPWSVLGFGITNNNVGERPINAEEAESIVTTFMNCADDWKLLLMLSVTEGAHRIGDESAGCVAERLTDDQAKAMLVSEIVRDYDDPSLPDAVPFPENILPLLDAFDECLTAQEAAGLDFN